MLLVFDLDGTLIDSAEDLAASASELATSLGGRSLDVAEVVGMVGEGAALLVRRALTAAGVAPDAPDALARFLAIYDRRLLDRTRPYDGIPDVLAELAPMASMAVLTNKPLAPSRRILEGLGLAGYFPHVIGGDGPFPRKPDPAGLRALAALAAGQPVLLVGDSPVDAATAAAAPAAFALASYGFGVARFTTPPDTPFVLTLPSDLPPIVDRLARASGL
ncbi:MAG: HAD-IA family hydrolase [Vicinamibacterales bacterium]|nr:HAD-IA family hydrolase [Vicinamibacterales bacterium]